MACALDKTRLERKEVTAPFGIDLMRNQVLHQDAQAQGQPHAVADCLSISCSDLNSS